MFSYTRITHIGFNPAIDWQEVTNVRVKRSQAKDSREPGGTGLTGSNMSEFGKRSL